MYPLEAGHARGCLNVCVSKCIPCGPYAHRVRLKKQTCALLACTETVSGFEGWNIVKGIATGFSAIEQEGGVRLVCGHLNEFSP